MRGKKGGGEGGNRELEMVRRALLAQQGSMRMRRGLHLAGEGGNLKNSRCWHKGQTTPDSARANERKRESMKGREGEHGREGEREGGREEGSE